VNDDVIEGRDGIDHVAGADHDEPYWPRQQQLSTRSHWRFTDRQFALLQCQRTNWREQRDQSKPWRRARPALSPV